jgi:hypothetical protein
VTLLTVYDMIRSLQLNSTSGDFMFGKLFAVCVTLCLASVSFDASAQSYNTGSQTCTQNYSLYDYYSNGRYTHSSWDADGVTCNDNGGGFELGGGYDGGGIIGPEGGGGAPLANAPNNPYNQNPATCKSDPEARIFHAAGDFATWKGIYAPKQIRGRGELFTVEFDGGGTEQYRWFGVPSPTAPPESYIAPIPNSLKCP